MHWQELPQSGTLPGPRSSHALAAVGQNLYLFGGEHTPRVPLPADMYCYDTASSTWSIVTPAAGSSCPGPRVAATMAALGDKLYLYGGRTGVDMTEGAKSDLYVFDTSSSSWAPVAVPDGSPQPPPRSYHAMAAVPAQGKLYVFGGCGSSGRLADLWCFDTASSTWQQCGNSSSSSSAAADSISARGGSVLVAAADGSKVYLLGGFNPAVPTGPELRDCHVFDTAANTWACPSCCSDAPPAAAAADGAAGKQDSNSSSSSSSSSMAMLLGRSVFGAVLHGGGGSSGCGSGGCEHAEHVVTFGGEVGPSDKGHAGEGCGLSTAAGVL
jgi:N-acetylneuraminic acid mutarotase